MKSIVLMLCLLAQTASAATITVITIADSGPGSLRQAIADASNGDTIVFDPILITKKIALTSGELLINKNITITGLGATNFAITGTTTSRVFLVTGGANATLASFTISGGTETNGGGIANFATLTLNNLHFTNNVAITGGAVYTSNGVLNVNNTTFNLNSATTGGALHIASGTATLNSSTLATNAATAGGAIANQGTLTLTNVLLAANTAVAGGALYTTNGTVTLRATLLRANTATNGAALYNDAGSTASLIFSNSITGNTATDNGGGLYNSGTLTITSSLVGTNTATTGGGIHNSSQLTLTSATLAGNTATRGAGLYTTNGTATATNTTFTGNTATTTGGAIHNDLDSTLDLIADTLTANIATAGGAIANFSTTQVATTTLRINAATTGGALYTSNSTTTIASTLFDNNSATTGGAIHNDVNGQLTIVISTLAGNHATTTGGAIQNAGTLTLAESTLANNTGATGAGLNTTGHTTLDNTLFAANTTGGNLTGPVTSKGFNLSDDNSGAASLTADGDLNNTSAGLDPAGLISNGGPTKTIALQAGSAAISAGGPVYSPFEPIAGGGVPVYPPFTDQRGQPRFVCGKMDIGAYQTQSTPAPSIALNGPALFTNECSNPFTDPGATAANNCGDALSVAGGGSHTLVITRDGLVLAWGNNANGQSTIPGNLTDPVGIAAGEFHSLGLREDGTVLAWGANANNQSTVPGNATNAVGISAGGYHSLAVDEGGTVLAWGDNTYGQTTIPTDATNAVAVAAGRFHSLALRSDGQVIAWGGGTFTAVPEDGINYGQANVPANVSNIVAIAAGAYHSLALRNDGILFGWGGGSTNVDFGQSTIPAGLNNVLNIAAGGYHSLALRTDGSILAWGNNRYGQTNVPALAGNSQAISAGTFHSLAITKDGTVAAWGLNSNNQTTVINNVLAADLTSRIIVITNHFTISNSPPSLVDALTQTYVITNGHGGSNSILRTLITMDRTPPVPNPLPSVTNSCTVTVTAGVATDACVGVVSGVALDPTSYTTPGLHTIRWTYSDNHGNIATQSQTAFLLTPPLVPVVNPLLTVTGVCTVTLPAPTATNGCATITGTTTNPTTYNTLGAHVVQWKYTDAFSNVVSQVQTAVVLAPVLTPSVNPLLTVTGLCTVTLPTPTATNGCTTVSGTTTNPTTYNTVGTHIVQWKYTDAFSNVVSQVQTAVVLAPTLVPVVDPLLTVTGVCSVTLSPPTATNGCATITGVTADPTTYNTPGSHLVHWSYTDAFSNNVQQTQTVVITIPGLVPRVDPLQTITGVCSATATAPTATNACGTTTAVALDPTSYNTRGNHLIRWTYSNNTGIVITQTQTIVIDRATPPTITCAGNIVRTNTPGQCGAIVHFNAPTTSPNCPSATLALVEGLPSGSLFPVGVTTNTFRVTDLDNNTAQCSFTVTVLDTQKPAISCPNIPLIISTAPGACETAPVNYPVTPTDNCPGLTVTFDPTNGTVFANGTTNAVTCTATDPSGNFTVCNFTVIVKDLAGPTMTCPADIITNALTSAGTAVTLPVVLATDSCTTASVFLSPPSGTVFPTGDNIVNAIAVDAAGNQTICTFHVKVLAPRTILQESYNQAVDLEGRVTGDSNLKQFVKGIDSLNAALNPAYWTGGSQVYDTAGKTVFKTAQKAVKTFLSLGRRTDTGVSNAEWLALSNIVSESMRSLAAIKVSDATLAGGDAKSIASANQSMADGDAAAAAGQPDRAIQAYAKAWQSAVKSLP